MVKARLKEAGAYQFWPVQTGLGAATVDCLACVPVLVTREMIGATVGLFVAIETKRADKPVAATPRQIATLREIHGSGGRTQVVQNQEDVDYVLRR